jgi:hypothetical protein
MEHYLWQPSRGIVPRQQLHHGHSSGGQRFSRNIGGYRYGLQQCNRVHETSGHAQLAASSFREQKIIIGSSVLRSRVHYLQYTFGTWYSADSIIFDRVWIQHNTGFPDPDTHIMAILDPVGHRICLRQQPHCVSTHPDRVGWWRPRQLRRF